MSERHPLEQARPTFDAKAVADACREFRLAFNAWVAEQDAKAKESK